MPEPEVPVQNLGLTEFRKRMIGELAKRWDMSYTDAVARVKEWLEHSPNPNDDERRPYRLKRRATSRDAIIHVLAVKKDGGYNSDGEWMPGIRPKATETQGTIVEIPKQGKNEKFPRRVFLEAPKPDEAVPRWVDE